MANQRALIQASLATFEKNKEQLLQRLIDGRKRGAETPIYDTTEARAILRRVAEGYLLDEQMRKSAPSNALREKYLNTLKQSLIVAHALLVKKMSIST